MVREVGPIAENVLEKYLGNAARVAARRCSPGVKLQKDGALDGSARRAQPGHGCPRPTRRSLLVDALNELLYAELLAVKRTLGAEHETALVRALRRAAVSLADEAAGTRARVHPAGAALLLLALWRLWPLL